MNSRRLRHFLAVYEHRSFGRAAEELHVTQPALSKSVQLLEEELNVKLFERTVSGVVPTVYGDALSSHARAVEAEMTNAAREIAMLSGAAKGEVKVGVTPSVAADLIPRTFLEMQEERPAIILEVIEGLMEHHIPALRQGELDVVIGGWVPGVYPDLETEFILSEEIQVFAGAGHPLSGKGPVPLEKLLEHPWVMPPSTQFWRHSFENTFISRGLQPPAPCAVANSSSFIRAMLLHDRYLSALPARLLIADQHSGTILPLETPEVDVRIEITATYRKRDVHLSAFNIFMSTLKTVC